jgi:tetratricopeptide (TPR) repeat protein
MSHPADWAPSPRARTLPAQRPSGLAGALALAAAATALLALRPLAGRGSASGDGGSGRPPVVAVLPFMNLSNDRSDEPLGTGIADVLVSKLSRLHGVALLPLSATQPYHGRRDDPRRVAADLGATYVVEGRVQRAGEHLRVTATLVDGGSGKVAWSEDFDAGRADVFALQHQLADGLAAALRLRLSPAERQALAQPPTSNVEAFADYSQARSFLERWDIPGNIDRAIQLLQSAVTKDSRFALAHAALGEAYWKQWKQTRQAQWTVKARDSSAEALRLDPNQPAVHYAMATIHNDTGRLNEAAEELSSALSLQPNSDSAHVLFAQVLSRQGRSEEALAHLRTAVSLRPQLWDNHRALGLAYFDRGRYAEAAASFQRITELQPDSAWGFQMLGTVHHASGNFGAALSAYQEAVKRGGSGATYTNLGMLHSREGRYAEAARAYEDALKYPPLTPLRYRNLGDAYRQLGREKDARRRYQQAMELSWKMLEVNPRDGRTMAMLAVVEAKLGRLADARTHAIDASRLRPDDGDVFFRKCVVHTLAREPEAAITALREALTRGYSRTLVLEDDDLKPLRGLASFQALLEQPRS